MKNIAILLCLLGFASSTLAAGTEIIIPAGGFQALENPVLTESEYKEVLRNGSKSKSSTLTEQQTQTYEKEVKFGSKKQSSPNSYWNHGRVNFGAGSLGNGGTGMNRW